MNAKDAIKYQLESTQGLLRGYLTDLSDADLLVRPVAGANHIAWQLGHLISAEATYFVPKLPGGKPLDLPAGFSQQHSNETAAIDPPRGFKTKAEYLELYDRTRAGTLAMLDRMGEADFDKPSGWEMANTVGKLLLTVANHDMMHAAQFTVVRRKLGKPVLF